MRRFTESTQPLCTLAEIRNNHDALASAFSCGTEQQRARARSNATAPRIGPNESMHLRGFPSVAGSIAGSVHAASICAVQGALSAPRLKTCHKFLFSLAMCISLWLILSIIYSKSGSDLGRGFTLGAYVIAVTAVVGTAVGAYHYPQCTCWKERLQPAGWQGDG